MTFPLERHTIFLTLAGSQAHGTAHEGSDVDLRGVCIAPASTRLSVFTDFEQYEGGLPDRLVPSVLPRIAAHETASRGLGIKTECVVYDVAKFVGLCAAANPNALEILFADERDWVLETVAWRRLHDERHRFLTKKIRQTFLGYALAQLRRIESHRSWLLHPPIKKPAREDFGLPAVGGALCRDDQNRIEQGLADAIRRYGIDDLEMPQSTRIALMDRMESFYADVLAVPREEVEARTRAVASHASSLPSDVVSTLNAEKKYRGAMKQWESHQAWKTKRNPARAELEREHGYDTKHAMHLIRLMRMGVEVLERGELRIRRDDAAELAAIRDGSMSFAALVAMARELQSAMEGAISRTELPDDVDHGLVDRIVVDLIERGATRDGT